MARNDAEQTQARSGSSPRPPTAADMHTQLKAKSKAAIGKHGTPRDRLKAYLADVHENHSQLLDQYGHFLPGDVRDHVTELLKRHGDAQAEIVEDILHGVADSGQSIPR